MTRDAYEADATALGGRPHRLPAGSERGSRRLKKLITQTLDPMLSAYFRDIAHKKTMLELLHERDAIQASSGRASGKFREFDIECVDVLIGKPQTEEAGGKIETLLPGAAPVAAALDRAARNLRAPTRRGRTSCGH